MHRARTNRTTRKVHPSMLNKEQIQAAADRLYEAEVNRKQIPALTLDHSDMDMADAYAVQKAWVDRKISEGRKVIGYKIGLTSRAMQMSSNIDEPDYGVLLDDMLFEDGATIQASDFLDPRIEVGGLDGSAIFKQHVVQQHTVIRLVDIGGHLHGA